MKDFLEFMLFSCIETIALTSITLTLFRFKFMDYFWQALLINVVMNIQSYFLREQFTLSELVPVINVILLSIFIFAVARVPIIWTFIMSLFGYVFTVVIQSVIVFISGSVAYVTATDLHPIKGHVIQAATGLIVLALSYILYKFGIGFAFQFEKLRFKWEQALILSLIILTMVALGILLYYRVVIVDFSFLFLALLCLAYFAFRKETNNR
ncbi:hypothetical protein [Cohnella sp. REN36]|uniref:hypothetical protein n=1 Tax=Cohnella sp. REN36 TaxID=2887347 RepID=UPI001D146C09|nr:hypothetical protein [Cohnella sp. REN36]MCC3374908.1 hypothetical protein [Cohnella sp. REN36]